MELVKAAMVNKLKEVKPLLDKYGVPVMSEIRGAFGKVVLLSEMYNGKYRAKAIRGVWKNGRAMVGPLAVQI